MVVLNTVLSAAALARDQSGNGVKGQLFGQSCYIICIFVFIVLVFRSFGYVGVIVGVLHAVYRFMDPHLQVTTLPLYQSINVRSAKLAKNDSFLSIPLK